MKIQDSDLQLFDKYISGDLSQEEIDSFDRRLSEDGELTSAFQVYKTSIISVKERAFVDDVADFMREKKGDKGEKKLSADDYSMGKSRRLSLYWYAAAASVLIVLSYFSWTFFAANSDAEVYLSYYAPYDGVVITRDDSGGYLAGLTAYNEGDYAKALTELLQAREADISPAQLSLLIGNCYMNLGELDKAIQAFGQIEDDNASIVLSNRDWYLALCYLKQGQGSKSRNLLNDLVINKTHHWRLAEKLLNEPNFK